MQKLHLAVTAALALAVGGCASPSADVAIAMADAVVPAAHASTMSASVQSRAVTTPLLQADPVADQLAALRDIAPKADPGVLALALEARQCAVEHGDVAADARLAVIDYSMPSTQRRLWIFDMADADAPELLYNEYVAHGQGSGGNVPTRFSNEDGTHATSLGLFVTAETYYGSNGYSLRMDGQDEGFNDNARRRAIVIHGADYVNPANFASLGRAGRSWGCPALRQAVAREVIDVLKDGQLVFSYADDDKFLAKGQSFACDGRSANQILAAARAPRESGNIVAAAP
ncbi:MAG TPA: murein L,D-transpeptidase catalytic domain family protein [Luteimonas sp.]|nr:murein L,D-transpeptidase catalytic domain family protein [Luteimonas sp.]